MRRILLALIALGTAATAQDGGGMQGGLSDPQRVARIEAVRGCFASAGTVDQAQACVGVWVELCLAHAEVNSSATELRCLVDEAGTWQALSMFLTMHGAQVGKASAPDLVTWTEETAAACGPDPIDGQMTGEATREGADCWARSAAERAFLLRNGG